MTEQHPITPPPELVLQWADEWAKAPNSSTQSRQYIATRAAQWGADQELEACCEWLESNGYYVAPLHLRTARRPKSPSLKQQALEALDHILNNSSTELGASTIRRALEALPE